MKKHTKDELKQWQSLPLEVKLLMAKARIRAFHNKYDGDVYVAISGGKDSKVLSHIVEGMYGNKVRKVFCNTGLEFNSVQKIGLKEADDILYPSMNFVQVVSRYGYPVISKEVSQAVGECQRAIWQGKEPPKYRMDKFNGLVKTKDGKKSPYNMDKYRFLLEAPFRIDSMCCTINKKKPSKKYEKETGRMPIVATMAEESRLRKSDWLKNGCNNYNGKRPISKPLSFFTEQDILTYIKLEQEKWDNAKFYVDTMEKYDCPLIFEEDKIKYYEAKKILEKPRFEIADEYGKIVEKNPTNQLSLEDFNIIPKENTELTTTGVHRTGCLYCLYGITQMPDKLLKIKEIEPKKYDFIMRGGKFDDKGLWVPDNGLGYHFIVDWLNEHGNLGILY